MFLSVRVLPAVFKLIRLKSASWLEFEVKLLDATMLPPVRVIVCVTTSGALTSIVPETVIVSPSLTLSIACFNSSSVLTVLSTANTAVGSILSTIVRANNTDKNLAFMVSSYNYRFEFENLLCAGMCFRCFFHLSLSLFASASTGHTCFPYHSMFVCGKQETFEKNCKENVKVLLRIQKERIALHARA